MSPGELRVLVQAVREGVRCGLLDAQGAALETSARRSGRVPGRVRPYSAPKDTAITEQLALGPGEAVGVLSGGDPGITLLLESDTGETTSLPAITGVVYAIPHARVRVTVPSGLGGNDLNLLQGPAETVRGIVGAASNDGWVPWADSVLATAGNANADLNFPTSYEVLVLSVIMVCTNDGTAASRTLTAALYDPTGTSAMLLADGNATVAASEVGHLYVIGGDVGVGQSGDATYASATHRWSSHGWPKQILRVEAAPATVHLRGSIVSGQAGDSFDLYASGLWRPIS